MRVNLFAFAVLAVAGLQVSAFAQTNQWQPSPTIEKVGYFQDDETDVAALQKTIEKLELRLREVEDDVEERLEAVAEADSGDAAKQADSFEKRMAELEEGFEENSEAITEVEDTLPSLLFHGHKNPKMQFFGRIHLDYWAFPNFDDGLIPLEAGGNPQDRFNFRRLRIGIKGDLNDRMFYKYEGEFAGGNNPSYRDAYIGFKDVPRLNTVIIGNHKRPYGLDHLNSSRHNVTIERPFIVEAFNQDSRRLGISSNGVSDDQSANWRFGVWNQVLTQTRSGYIGDDYQLELAGRYAKTYWYDESSGGRGWGHVAISGSIGDPGFDRDGRSGADYRTRPEARSDSRWLDTGIISNAQTNYLIGLESAWNVGSLAYTGEYMRVLVDRDAGSPDVDLDGYYGQLSYFLTGEHRAWNRKTGTLARIKPLENFFMVKDCDGNCQRGWGAWEVYGRYSKANLTDQDIIGGDGESFTAGVNWYWNAYARMQFNYINGTIDRDPIGSGDYEIFGARMMVDF
ncbi:porin [Mariniblastus sp.]|nr:porin [Mariniblastus sp.]